jgi:hypothetical protein
MMVARFGDDAYEPPDGVLVELSDGERLDVPYDELELLWREHPCRAEPDGTLPLWLLHELWKFDWYEAFERVFERTYPALAKLYHPWERDGSEQTATWTAVTMHVPWARETLRPLVWWPADRAWAAHCDVDWTFTCVGGTEELINAIVADPGLEAVRISADEIY